MVRKMFILYRSALLGLVLRKVTEEQVSSGLFVIEYTSALNFNGLDQWLNSRSPEVHQRVVEILRAADQEGRVAWCAEGAEVTFDMVSTVLVANGYQPLLSHEQAFAFGTKERAYRADYFPGPSLKARLQDPQVELA